MPASATRSYSQTQRAESTAATRRAILDAAIAQFREEGDPDPSLEAVAARAGCSTRSVIRHFGSKERLIEAAIEDETAAVAASRRVEPGDVAGAVQRVVGHYERLGDDVVRWLASAERYPLVRRVTERGAQMHRDWVRASFAPNLSGLAASERRRRVAALATVTDVYVWHLLRRREELSRRATEAEILALVERALDGPPWGRAVRLLAYTSPARGHLNPMMGPLVELRQRGAEVHVRTLSSEVEAVRAAGLECEPLDPAIEAIVHDDHEAPSQVQSGRRSFATLGARAPLEVADLEAALAATRPDAILLDSTTYGAKALAEREGLVWAESRPSLLEDPAPGVPPFGLGLRPLHGPVGRLRDGSLGLLHRWFDRKARLPAINAGRQAAGLPPLPSVAAARHRAALTLYFTAEPFEYRRPLPPSVVMVGASVWDTPSDADPALPEDERPLAVVACSSEFQDDGAIAAAALAGLRGRWRLVVTTAGVDPATLGDPGDAVVARFLPHGPLLRQADVVVCHGGMGITQKALAAGVPVCVVPWGRDQLEVAAHVVEAEAGTRVARRRLSPQRLAAAVERAHECQPGAARVRAGFEATGGSATAANSLEAIVAAPAP